MTPLRGHLISVVLAERGIISSSTFELVENELSFASEFSVYNAKLTILFLTLFLVYVSHVNYLALHDFSKHFPPFFQHKYLQPTLHVALYIDLHSSRLL